MNGQILDDLGFFAMDELWNQLTSKEIKHEIRPLNAYLLADVALTFLHVSATIAARNQGGLDAFEAELRRIEPRYFTSIAPVQGEPRNEFLRRNASSVLAWLDANHRLAGLREAVEAPHACIVVVVEGPEKQSDKIDSDSSQLPHLSCRRRGTSLSLVFRPNLLFCHVKEAVIAAHYEQWTEWNGFEFRQPLSETPELVQARLVEAGHSSWERSK